MARGTSKTNTDWMSQGKNEVKVVGQVKRILVDTDKVLKFSLDVPTKTKNDKYAHAFITVVSFDFDGDLKEGDIITVSGAISTSSYQGKFSTEVVAEGITLG